MQNLKAQEIYEKHLFHNQIMHNFLAGISHAESVLELPFKHNSMNWILGHIIANRSHVLESLGAEHNWQEEIRKLYHQDTPPITSESPSLNFEKLIEYLDESVVLLKSVLENMSEEKLDENYANYRGEKTRYEHVSSFHWHESFHLGQLEILKAFIESER
ncbi:MAG: DinB family protein [Anaerolineae bacterium]|jgi:hypothetical protein|nr:DinB family protein [Anaerolineae bacterium]MBT7074392.1 DinB family protein [Anaerolineae bacterium]MBT7783306.1 DinB family protein [Anaerolineae bacterium]